MTDNAATLEVPLDPAAWGVDAIEYERTGFLGRSCLAFGDTVAVPVLPGIELEDGVVEVDLAVSRERSFQGVIWRAEGNEDFESFFVRPHQVGNPDAIQYTPVNHGVSSWQLYHGPGFWAPITFPIDDWFTIRVAFAGARADIHVGDLGSPALRIAELKRAPASGRIGLLVGGAGLRVARIAYSPSRPVLGALPQSPAAQPGVIRRWDVSDPIAESVVTGLGLLPPDLVAARSWTPVDAEPSGLLDLSRVNGLHDGRNTVLVRTAVRAPDDLVAPLELGFSDRATVYLDGLAHFRGDDAYRSRDYQFLGSIGFYDTVYLPLRRDRNELVMAVSEDLGGWGIQARFGDGWRWRPDGTIEREVGSA